MPVIPTTTQQGFPQNSAPFVNPGTGTINPTWLQLLITLWNRTGQGSGSQYDPANVAITGGSINGTTIGNMVPATINGTTIVATQQFVGNLTGNITGNVTGDIIGNVLGNVVGNLTGNVTGNVTGNLTGDVTGDVNGNVTGNVVGNVAGTLFGVPLGVPGAAGADSVIFLGADEFSYNPNAIIGTDDAPLNCSYDLLVLGTPTIDAVGNINYTLQQDLSACPSVGACVLWCQWFTIAAGTSADMGVVEPAINDATYNILDGNTWSVNGVSAASALKLPGAVGGTSDDTAFLLGAQLLASRGYKVGICPVVVGVDTDMGVEASEQTIWRGTFSWPDTPTFQAWLADYETMVQHYVDMLVDAGIPIDVVYLASEMQNLAINETDAIWGYWVEGLKGLADYIKAASPDTKITYAANWGEYSVGANFREDSLWTYPSLDYVGVDWNEPFAVTEGYVATVLQQGLRSGENMDWTVDDSDTTQRAITTTDHVGKTGLPQTAILAPQGSKNLAGFYYNSHYIEAAAANQAEATPLAGYDRTYNPVGMSVMTNVPAFGLSVACPAASGAYGTYPAPAIADTWAEFDGVDVGQLTLPTWGDTQYWYYFDFNFQITDPSPVTFSRLFRIPDVLECITDVGGGNMVKLAFGPSMSANYLDVCAIDTNYHTVRVRLDVVNLQAYLTVDGGAEVQHSVPDAVAITSAETMYVAGYDGSNNQLQYNLYYLLIKEAVGTTTTTTPTYGGTFYFDEPYCGVRTAWTPELKPVMVTGTGVASIGGSPVEPSTIPNADYGTPTVTLPVWLDEFTRTQMESWFALGWNTTEIYGPYGSDFSFNEISQGIGLLALVKWMQSTGFIPRVCVYAMDARPAATMLAQYDGTLWYTDGPLYKLGQQINGKLAGGVYNSAEIIP